MLNAALSRWLSVWGLALATVAASLDATTAAETRGRKYAVVIGVSYCEDPAVSSLPFVENDVALLVETLAALGFEVYPFCEESVKLDRNNRRVKTPRLPTKENVEKAFSDEKSELSKALNVKDATLLVYFSGHGGATSEKSERTRLFMRDSQLNDMLKTTLRAQALREMIAAAECERRLLLLDSCYAAGTRAASPQERKKYVELFQGSFREGGVDGAPTFASCSFPGKSYRLIEKAKAVNAAQKKRDVSAFTYWLNEALKGRADGAVDGKSDGVVDSGELFEYVERNIAWMRSVGRAWQTPAIVASTEEETFAICAAPRRGYAETIDDLAELIVMEAKILGKKDIYVEDFVETFASAELREKEASALHSFAVSTTELLRASVREKLRALGQGTSALSGGETNDSRYVAKGVVEARWDAKREVEYAMTYRDKAPRNVASVANVAASVGRKDAPEGSMKGFDDGTRANVSPMNVRIEARSANGGGWRSRPIREIAGASWVELNPGETYRVLFEPNVAASNDEELTIMRLMVDGRNSLAQYEPYVAPPSDFIWQIEPDGNETEAAEAAATTETAEEAEASATTEAAQARDGEATFDGTARAENAQVRREPVLAPVVPLERANFWVLRTDGRYAIDGFVDLRSQTSAVFTVVEADASDAEEADAEERGLIVVAFYKAARSRNALGDAMTEPGPKRRYSAIVVDGLEPGAPLGLTRLRYASAEFLARLEQENAPSTPSVGAGGE